MPILWQMVPISPNFSCGKSPQIVAVERRGRGVGKGRARGGAGDREDERSEECDWPRIRASTRAHACTSTRAHIHTFMHEYTRAHTYIHTRTVTRTHEHP